VKLRTFSTLQIALGISIAVHAALLTVRLVDPESFNRVFEDTPLEVILVNARSVDRNDKAKAIAQTALTGGGEASVGRATSPLPTSSQKNDGQAFEDETQKQLQSLQKQQSLLLAQIRKDLAALPKLDEKQPNATPDDIAREEKRRQLIRHLAEIERRINEDNARPKKRYISPSTRDEVYAVYYDRLRRSIEDKGTQNFPESSGKKLYGELTMVVTVNHNGQILETEIVESSGSQALDLRAQAIVKSAGPFGNFDVAMRRQADQIVVVSRFRFTRDETLETRVSARP
jgi:periplasmic protein TonB